MLTRPPLANNGIGFELAGQLASKNGFHVLLGSRSLEKGTQAARRLQSRNLPGSVEAIQLDVSSDDSIAQAVEIVRWQHGHIDALVNNAGISGLGDTTLRQRMHECFDTNAAGAALVAQAFAPLLLEWKGTPRLLNVSSGSGSIERTLGNPSGIYRQPESLPYAVSKAAMNMVAACQAITLGPRVKVFAWCPGFTASSFSGMNTPEMGAKPVVEVAEHGVRIIEGKRDSEAGHFLSNAGQYIW